METNLFQLPAPLPEGAVFLGPPAWANEVAAPRGDCQCFEDPDACLAWLESDGQETRLTAVQPSRLILIHQDAFAGGAGADTLVTWLEDVARLRGPFLSLLLHGDLASRQLVRFFRAGLFDALNVPVSRSGWVNMLIRAEKKFEFRSQSRLILERTGQTQSMLHTLHRQLQDETSQSTGDLLRAQESLEAANQQLSAGMAELSLLYRFGRELSTAKNWDKVLREMLKTLSDFVAAGGAALILKSAAGPGGTYSARQTWQWEESSWDKVVVNLQDQVDAEVAESLMGPGIFDVQSGTGPTAGGGRRIIALPLEHMEVRLGFLLLMFATPEDRAAVSSRYLPFLQAVQMVLSEEVASAQLLDRIRDIGSFNARVLETVRSAIWVIDETGRTVYCNRAGQVLLTGRSAPVLDPTDFIFELGRGRGTGLGSDVLEDLPELLLDARLRVDGLEGLVMPALRTQEDGVFRGEGTIIDSHDEGVPILIQTALMPGRLRDETWLVVVAEDLRDSRKLEVERLRSDRLEGLVEMSATLAHEIRNPLMGLSAQAELLADQLPPDDPRSRYIEVITGEVERINDTITRMLNFVRPYEPELGEGSLRDLVRDSLDLVRPRADAKAVTLTVTGGEDDPARWVNLMDPGQIKQVLLNLLINGIDAAPRDGRVELALTADPRLEVMDALRGTHQVSPGFRLAIRDNGPGFKPEDQAKLFRPFFTTKASGTGLGLSLCQKIVAAHGGEILAGRDGEHTVFQVLLPRRSAAQANTPAAKQEEC